MAFTAVVKEKNLVLFRVDDARAYSFDINTGIWYGLKGKPLTGSAFAGLATYLDSSCCTLNVLYLLSLIRKNPSRYGIHHTPKMNEFAQFAEYFKIADRLESIGYTGHYYNDFSLDTLKKVSDYFKPFAKWLKNNKDKNFSQFLAEREYDEWIAKHHLAPNNHGVTETLIKKVWYNRHKFEDADIDYVVYYASHGLMDFYNIEEVAITSRFGGHGYGASWEDMFSKIRDYLRLCKEMDVKPEKENMLQLYVNLRRTYMTNRKVFDAKALKEWYNRFPMLQFKDDNYTVVIPQTREDFINEANAQNNCVYSYYFEPVTRKETLVVFIRKNDNLNKSYITCEISPESGYIRQYLTTNNYRVNDKLAIDFREKYERHILDNWNKGK